MADIKVEQREPRRRKRFPAWLLAIPVLGLLLYSVANNDNHNQVGGVQDHTVASVNYQGKTLLPDDYAVNIPDARMKAVGETVDGRTLFAADESVGGGGGGASEGNHKGNHAGTARVGTAIADHLYIRTGEDWYRPMVAETRGAKHDKR